MSRQKGTSSFLSGRPVIPVAIMVLILASLLVNPAMAGQIVTIVPHPQIGNGDLRSEVKASARRLLGLADSFNPDSFIAHIMYVNGLTSKDIMPQKAWARSLSRKLDRRGVITSKSRPQPGDLAFFSLSADAPHSSKATNQTVAVVEKVSGDQVTFIYAGPQKIARGTLTLSDKKSNQTRFLKCSEKIAVKDTPSKKSRGKSKGKKGKGDKDSKKGKKAKTTTRQLPCTAHDLLIGFADIEVAALTLNHIPPASDMKRASDNPAQDGEERDFEEADPADKSEDGENTTQPAPDAGTEARPDTDSEAGPDTESDATTGTGTVADDAHLNNKTLDRILNDDVDEPADRQPADD